MIIAVRDFGASPFPTQKKKTKQFKTWHFWFNFAHPTVGSWPHPGKGQIPHPREGLTRQIPHSLRLFTQWVVSLMIKVQKPCKLLNQDTWPTNYCHLRIYANHAVGLIPKALSIFFVFLLFSQYRIFLFCQVLCVAVFDWLKLWKIDRMSAQIPFLKGQCQAVWVELQYGKSHLKSKERKTSAKDSFARPLNLLVHWIRIQLRMARMEKGWDFANVFKFWTRYIKKN